MSKKQKLEDIRKLMLSLLLARKGATLLSVLERDYYEAESRRIPYHHFGFTDLVGFLQSMPEHFIVEQYNGTHYVRGIASEKSKHVGLLVARQKTQPKPKYIPPHLRQPLFNRRAQHMKSQQVKIAPDKLFSLMCYIKNNPHGVSLQNAVAIIQQIVPFINITTQELRAQLYELSHQLYLDGNMIYPVWNNDARNVAQQPLMEESQRDELQSDSRSLPAAQIECAAGQEDFVVQYFSDDDDDFVPAAHIDNQRHAETSEQFATSHNTRIAQYANYERTEMFDKARNNGTEIDEVMATNSNMEINAEIHDLSQIVNDRTKLRLEELMRKHPEGIWCADLPNVYFHEYKVRLNYTQLGFASVREFTSYLPKIFYMKQINKTDDFMLYSADKRPVVPKSDPIDITQTSHNRYGKHSTAQCSKDDDDDAPIPSDVSPTITKSFAPNDVMNYNDNVEKISVTELQKSNEYLAVYIVEVFHPNFFWIHLRENKRRFYKMMDELSDFYEYNKNTYTIAKIALKKDMNCACLYMGRWHRGIIKSVKPDFRVTVFFYDYGTLKTYAPEDIYYLHKKFSFLPAQAIPCGLYNVIPSVGDRWKKSVIDQFIDKTADTLLAATIISINPMYNSMMVILTDTSEEEDVVINKWLVNERLAQVGKTADTVDMASIMKYVVNNLNQLPTYCFAEESLMPDNCCKTTSTKEKYEVPLVSSGSTLLHYDSHNQQQPMKPPPGFPPLGEQHILSNLSTSFPNDYSFANVSNVKASIFSDTEMVTNPFLTDEQVIPDAKQMYMSVWNENKKLQIRMIDILNDLLERLSLSFKNQIQLNKILKVIEKVLLEQKERSTAVKTPSVSNSASETSLNNVGSAQKTTYNLNGETFVKQDLNTFLTSNPFSVSDDERSQSNSAFSYGSDFTFNTNWSNSDELNPHVQVPPSTTASPTPSTFTNRILPANTFFPNTKQNGENVPSKPVSPPVPTSTSNFSEILNNMKTQFADMLKSTNPFKCPVTDETRVPETQNERTSCNHFASYLSSRNPQSHASKAETANIHATSNCFTPAGHVSGNYIPRIVYESSPVMYNTQKKQADANTRQNTRGNNLDNVQNTQSRELRQDKKPTSQPANDIATSYVQNTVINPITRDNSQVSENYVTQPLAYYTQASQPITNGEPTYYQQNGNANDLQSVSSQSWNQIKIPEHRANSKTAFQNSVPLSNHNEAASFGTSTSLFHQDWNCNRKKSIPREMNEATDLNYIFKFKNGHDKERPMDIYTNSRNNTVNGSIQGRNTGVNTFIFQKIDSVKGVTFIFNVEQDGWILTYEFIETFTNLKLQSLLAMLETMNIKVLFKEVHRSEYPIQFSELDRYPLNVPRDSEKRIISINLISLQNALTLLHKLKIVSREEIDNAFKKNEFLDDSVLSTLWISIVAYRNLKRHIELRSNYI